LIGNLISKKTKPDDIVATLCAATGVPLVVCYVYIMLPEICGPLPELEKGFNTIVRFYRYDEVVPFSKKEVENG
jgi:hypothetical protein